MEEKIFFRKQEELGRSIWGTSLLPQVVLISLIKPILSIISEKKVL